MTASPTRLFCGAKGRGERFAMISLYDAPSAALCCDAGVDVILVGDSLGNVVLGHESTVMVTMQDMLLHTAAVARGARSSSRPDVPIIGHLPFGSYASPERAAENAAVLTRAGAHGVKLEGAGPGALAAVRTVVEMGVPVVGHLGCTPQSALRFVKRYADAHALLSGVARDFVGEVKSGAFPMAEHGRSMDEAELAKLPPEAGEKP